MKMKVLAEPSEKSRILDTPGAGFGCRHLTSLLIFLAEIAAHVFRANLSVAIVAMVSHPLELGASTATLECPDVILEQRTIDDIRNVHGAEFSWSEHDQGIVFGAYYWGYVVTVAPGGLLVDRFGAKRLMVAGLMVASVAALSTTIMVRTGGIVALALLRILQGFGAGVIQPCGYAIMAKWIPPLERSKLVGFALTGNTIGIIVAMLGSGHLAAAGYLGGWPSIFYASGIFGIICMGACVLYLHDCPHDHPMIDDAEKRYLESCIGQKYSKVVRSYGLFIPRNVMATAILETKCMRPRLLGARLGEESIPWKAIVSSLPIWAILVAQLGYSWGQNIMMTELPNYFKNMLHYGVEEAGFWTALSYAIYFGVAVLSSWLADWLLEKKHLTTTATRKLFNTLALGGSTLAITAASHTGCNRAATVPLLLVANGILGCSVSAFLVNYIDVTPNYAPLIFGLANGLSSTLGILVPYLVGYLTNNQQTFMQWQLIFYISGLIFLLCNTFYVIFASGEEEPWNSSQIPDKKKEFADATTKKECAVVEKPQQATLGYNAD